MVLGNRKAPFKSRLRCLAVRAREDQRHSQAGLKTHFLDATACGLVERKNRPLGPAMTFRKQRHGQKNRYRRGSKLDADFSISIWAKTPFQSCAHIGKTGDVERP